MKRNYSLLLAALFGMLAVLLGAFGAHGLERTLHSTLLARYHTGVTYQFYHALALLVIGLLWEQQHRSRLLLGATLAFSLGILLFSGSLYAYALSGWRSFGMITPLGGVSLVAGWCCVAVYAWRETDFSQK